MSTKPEPIELGVESHIARKMTIEEDRPVFKNIRKSIDTLTIREMQLSTDGNINVVKLTLTDGHLVQFNVINLDFFKECYFNLHSTVGTILSVTDGSVMFQHPVRNGDSS